MAMAGIYIFSVCYMHHFFFYFQCESVDKRHAVVTFDHYLRRFKVKEMMQ